MRQTTITVPCFNEERRLQWPAFESLLDEPAVRLRFVDDGSRDGTAALLREFAARGRGRVDVLALERNGGKAEAVRRGMLASLDDGAAVVGFIDADLATPPGEVLRLLRALDAGAASVVMGSRVQRLGSTIRRKPARHYLGRVFATAASIALGVGVYDTQCGAKFFLDLPALREALSDRFISRWAFDVELIGRLLRPRGGAAPLREADFLEVPLDEWRDVAGSKLRATHMLKAGADLVQIGARLRSRSRQAP